jgi:hypothetical protein
MGGGDGGGGHDIINDELIFSQKLILPALQAVINAFVSFCQSSSSSSSTSSSSSSFSTLSHPNLTVLVPIASELLDSLESIIKQLPQSQIDMIVSPLLDMIENVWKRFAHINSHEMFLSSSSSPPSSSSPLSPPFSFVEADKKPSSSSTRPSPSTSLVLSSLFSILRTFVCSDGRLRPAVEVFWMK